VAFVLGSGIALSLFAYNALRERDRTARQATIDGRVAGLVARLRETLETPIESANSVAGLFGASNLVERDEFRSFVGAALGREPLIHALQWAPRVRGDERNRFEAEVRVSGLGDYEIRELGPERRLVRAPARDEYLPLVFIEPHRPSFGFDILSRPERRALLGRACRTATAVASGRTRLVEDPPDETAVMVYVPAWPRGSPPDDEQRCRDVMGYVVLVFRVQPILTAVIRDVPLGDLELAILDVDAPPDEALLAETEPGAAARIAASAQRTRRSLSFVDRAWAVDVAPRRARTSVGPIAVLVLGLVATVVVTTLVTRTARRALGDATGA